AAALEVSEAIAEPEAPMPAEPLVTEVAAQPEAAAAFEPFETETIASFDMPVVTDAQEPEPAEEAAALE
ncbi:hypothetical protein, partial [Chromobacterium subtsugae]